MTTYDAIFAELGRLTVPDEEDRLDIEWISHEKLAVGRDCAGRFLVLLAGSSVTPQSPSVEAVLTTGRWLDSQGSVVDGSLLQLPGGEPFHVATTTIAVEFLRRGVESRPVGDVYLEVEPFIELVIRRLLLPPEALLGLLGELLVLDYVVEAVSERPAGGRPPLPSLWRGHARESRDIVLHRLAIEVKTTASSESRHSIGGLDQIEPRTLEGGVQETLRLASIGLAPEPSGSSRFSVSQLAQRILGWMDEDSQAAFLSQLQSYGPADCTGYDHRTMADWEPYARRYRLTFVPRLYDVADPRLVLIRRSDLQGTVVQPDGISYQVLLPEVVPGSHGANPRSDLREALRSLVAEFA